MNAWIFRREIGEAAQNAAVFALRRDGYAASVETDGDRAILRTTAGVGALALATGNAVALLDLRETGRRIALAERRERLRAEVAASWERARAACAPGVPFFSAAEIDAGFSS